jgi:hypothetical protein
MSDDDDYDIIDMTSSDNNTLDQTLSRWICVYQESTFWSALAGPVVNLFNVSNFFGWVIAWGILVTLYYLFLSVFPIRWYNSKDGYIDAVWSAIFAFLTYYGIVFFIILFGHRFFCKRKTRICNSYKRRPGWCSS